MNTPTIGTLFVFLAVVSLVAAHPTAYGVHADDPTVTIPDGVGLCTEEGAECYDPVEIVVAEGTTVTWVNEDESTPLHTVTNGVIGGDDVGDLFDSEFISPGSTFEYTFDEPGRYDYFCLLHPRMSGVVVVEEAHAEGDHHRDTDDKMMMDVSTMTLGGEIMVKVGAESDPVAGSPLTLGIKFTDSENGALEHINFDVLVMQGNTRVYSASDVHEHGSQHSITTRALATDDPVDVRVTFQGYGLPDTPLAERAGPVGEMVEFEDVPEFGAIAVVILIASIVAIVAVSARSAVFTRI